MQSAQRIALSNGYDSFLMFNVYAQRATRPDDMERCLQRRPSTPKTGRPSGTCSPSPQRPAVWAAWGNIIEKRGYLMDCMRDFAADGQAAGARWFTAGPLLKVRTPPPSPVPESHHSPTALRHRRLPETLKEPPHPAGWGGSFFISPQHFRCLGSLWLPPPMPGAAAPVRHRPSWYPPSPFSRCFSRETFGTPASYAGWPGH